MKIKNILCIVNWTITWAILALFLNSCSDFEINETQPIIIAPERQGEIEIPAEKPTRQENLGKDLPPAVIEEKKPEIAKEKIKVAALLPLTGKDAKIGQAMLNSINLALFDTSNRIELTIFDNKSDDYESQKAIEEIASKNIKLVLGPIFTSSVEAIKPTATKHNIVVISFSNNSDLINYDGIFLAGFSPEQEVERSVSYLIHNKRKNFLIVAPNNQYGIRMVKVLRDKVKVKDANFISSQFFIESTKDFSKLAIETLNSFIVPKEFKEYKKPSDNAKNFSLSRYKIYADSILIADSSSSASKIAEQIQLNNSKGRDLQIIGNISWDKDSIINDPNLSGAIFAGPDNQYYLKFKERYQQVYNLEPIRISSIAYDVTSFVIDLTNRTNKQSISANEVVLYNDKRGYNGLDGGFRFLPNGIVERNFAILTIENGKLYVVDPAQRSFLNY